MSEVRRLLEQHSLLFRKDDNSKFEIGKLYISLDELDYSGILDKLEVKKS